jgi:hypothetical protein
MANFIETGTLAGPMADAKPLPAGANPNLIPNLTAARWNAHRDALLELREHSSGFVNVRSYGAKGDGVTDDYAALSAMVTALGSAAATLIVPGPCLVGTDLTIPANLPVRFEGAGAFTGAGAVTYTAWKRMPSDAVSVADFGIVPDGVTNWASVGGARWTAMMAAAVSTGVIWPPGYYATGINLNSSHSGLKFHFMDGAILGSVFHMISGPSPTTVAISSISRASNVVTVVTSAVHPFTTGQRIQIRGVTVSGSGSVDFNTDDVAVTVANSTTFTYTQTGQDEAGTGGWTNERPLKNVRITGTLTTTDRFGTINAKDCYVERVWVKNDPTQHSMFPGLPARGVHLYSGTDNLRVDDMVVDYAGGDNTDAALAIDGNGWNPSRLSFGRVWIKDAEAHGAYVTGGGHTFGELRIDAFGAGVYSGTLQDSDGAVQSQHVKSVWINRAWDLSIGTLRTSQNLAGTRGYEASHALVDETGLSTFGSTSYGVRIGTWYASNVRRNGIYIGDRDANSLRSNVSIGHMEIRMAPDGLFASQYALWLSGASSGQKVTIDTLRFVGLGATPGIYTETTTHFSARRIEAVGHNSQMLHARGRVTIGEIYGYSTGNSSVEPVVRLGNPAVSGSYLGAIHLDSPSKITTRAFQVDAAASGWDVGKITTSNYANATGVIYLDAVLGWGIHALRMTGPSDVTGIAIRFNASSTDGYLGPGRATGFTQGIDMNAAVLSRITAVGLGLNGNTTPTNVPAGQIQTLGCTGVTL